MGKNIKRGQKPDKCSSGADPGFFLGGGALVSSNKPHSFFCRIPVVLENRRSSQGGGGAHLLHPPPRSAPAPSKAAISTPKRGSWYHSLLCGFRRGGEGGSIFSCLFLLNGLTLHVRHIGFASSAILKILQQTCTASVGSDSLSCGPLHSNSLSYPILSYTECSRQSTALPPITHLLPKR